MTETNLIDADQQHLKLLSIFHYVVGGMLYFFGFIPIMHLLMGILMVTGSFGSENQGDEAIVRVMGCFLLLISTLFMLCAWTLATLTIITGKKITKRLSYTFCLVMAGIECLFMPFGTILGVFTIIVLCRPSVKAQFTTAKSNQSSIIAENGANLKGNCTCTRKQF